MKKYLLSSTLLASGAVVAGLAYFFHPKVQHPDAWPVFLKVQQGMTEAQVHSLLAEPMDTLSASQVPASAEGPAVHVSRWFDWRGMMR